MKKLQIYILNSVLLSIVFIGLWSILATSPPPPSLVYDLSAHPSILCQGSETTLIWENRGQKNASKVTLSASPLENISIKLDQKEVELTGRLKVRVEGEVTISVDAQPEPEFGRSHAQVWINLVPQEVCQSFSFNPIGFYEGTIELNSPQKETLGKWIDIVLLDSLEQFQVQMGSSSNFKSKTTLPFYSYSEHILDCGSLTKDKELSCTETNPYEQISLIGKFNGNNFEGAYNYKREGENSEEGTFNFIRQ